MHFANKNLLYQMHQSLGTQHVTAGVFKRYARSPETRTFNNYFRLMRTFFPTYLRKRPQYSFSRYISLHKRKKNPILTNFTAQIKTTILTALQQLRPLLPSGLKSHASGLIIQNKPILQTDKISVTPYNLGTTNHEQQTGEAKNKHISNPIHRRSVPKIGPCIDSCHIFPNTSCFITA